MGRTPSISDVIFVTREDKIIGRQKLTKTQLRVYERGLKSTGIRILPAKLIDSFGDEIK